MEMTLGGNRLGSGEKMTVQAREYQMASFNQEQDFKSTMAPGVLVPFLKLIGTNHGTFDIDLDQFVRTLPTNAPLFGSFKMQADIFCVPFRLYQGILHNNPVKIGLKMDQVYLPKIDLHTMDGQQAPRVKGSNKYNYQIADNALLKYLGLSGIATSTSTAINDINRKFNAIPILAYYDIFKNYYANKQEEKAYVITPGEIQTSSKGNATIQVKRSYSSIINDEGWESPEEIPLFKDYTGNYYIKITYEDIDVPIDQIVLKIKNKTSTDELITTTREGINDNLLNIYEGGQNKLILKITPTNLNNIWQDLDNNDLYAIVSIKNIEDNENATTTATINLTEFPLSNIDRMRQMLLSNNFLGQEFVINEQTCGDLQPYKTLIDLTDDGITYNAFSQNGLVVKTYQSDLFNNWLNNDTIDEITQKTTMDTSSGFSMDDLNFMEKAYNVLTRIAITDGTYEDWQEAVYGEGAIRRAETPMYMGGMSAEIMFEEVIATSEASTDGNYQALGALGGKGTSVNRHGGNNIHIKCEEPCYIIGIVSITPRISYSQGNDWDLTDLNSMNDLHKPGFDGIGFQDLMIEQFAWWNTKWYINQGNPIIQRHSAGKQIAWINYQTAVDKVFGDFADIEKAGFMVLNRNYERDENSIEVKDLTTYIDPAKFNYAFSYTNLDAQNFWVQIHSKVIARRKMAAQQIPNL